MTWRGVDSGRPSGRSVGTDAGRPRPQTLPRRRPRGFIQQADHHLGVCPARVSPLMAIPVETITSAGTGWVITFLGWLSLVLYHCWLDPFGSPTPATEFHGDKKPAPLRTSWVHEVGIDMHVIRFSTCTLRLSNATRLHSHVRNREAGAYCTGVLFCVADVSPIRS